MVIAALLISQAFIAWLIYRIRTKEVLKLERELSGGYSDVSTKKRRIDSVRSMAKAWKCISGAALLVGIIAFAISLFL